MKIAKFTPPPTTPGGFRPTTREPNPGQDRVELGRTRPPEERWSLRKKAGLVAEGAMGTVDALSQVAPLVVLGTALGVVGGGVSNALLHTGLDSTLTGLVGTELGFLVAGYLCNRSLTQLPADLSAEQKLQARGVKAAINIALASGMGAVAGGLPGAVIGATIAVGHAAAGLRP